ncbi:hypothetical protein ACWDUD_04700 [Rhodococcus sp. NPDC003382]
MTTVGEHAGDRPVQVFRGPGDVLLCMTNVRGLGRDRVLRRGRTAVRPGSEESGSPAAGLYARCVRGRLGHAARSA